MRNRADSRTTTARDERNLDRAVRLAEATSIIPAKARRTAQSQLHIAGPDGQTLCHIDPDRWVGVFLTAREIKSTARVCVFCVRLTEQAYGSRMSAEQVLRSYNEFMAREAG